MAWKFSINPPTFRMHRVRLVIDGSFFDLLFLPEDGDMFQRNGVGLLLKYMALQPRSYS
jgi:hypothetical protein